MIQTAWRLCRRAYAAHAFDGEGARLFGGRWNPPGVPVVYTSATLSLAALEMLVHVDVAEAPSDLVAIPVTLPDGVLVRRVELAELPREWRGHPAPPALQQLGAAWVRGQGSAVLAVPSALIPQERNFLLNPAHPEFRRLAIGKAEPFTFDPRLVR